MRKRGELKAVYSLFQKTAVLFEIFENSNSNTTAVFFIFL